MSETNIQVQPAATQGIAAPAPQALKMVAMPDGTLAQVFILFDDQGRALAPMTEATGQQIVRLLTQLFSMTAVSTGGLVPSDDAAGLSNPG